MNNINASHKICLIYYVSWKNQSSIAYGFCANDLLSVVVTELSSTSATLNWPLAPLGGYINVLLILGSLFRS